MSLVEKMRRARESRVEAGGFTFVIRRPTTLEMIEIQDQPRGRAILPFVIGWEGVKELDLIAGGDPHPLEFDPAVAAEWLTDRADLLGALSAAIFDSYVAHAKRQEEAQKN